MPESKDFANFKTIIAYFESLSEAEVQLNVQYVIVFPVHRAVVDAGILEIQLHVK
jgi:hypothetical protein